MRQIVFEEVEYYGKKLYICDVCKTCIHKCKIKSEVRSIDIICKKYKKANIKD